VSSATTAFRDRKVLFVLLLAALAANVAALVSYRTFYDDRLQALVSEKASLEKRRDDTRRRAEAAEAQERKLFETQESLNAFFSETLGKRKERIAPLLEEIYATTRAAGLRPDAISYASTDEPGTDSLTMTFSVAGPYGDVKRLLSGLERSKRFLVVEQVGLSGGGETDPDGVRISITVTNYFRPGSLRPIKTVRDPRSATKGRAAAPAPAPAQRGRSTR
jgi:Tfp pilus assembly protein PilO